MSGRHDALGSAKTDKSFQYTADLLAAIFTWGGIGYLIDSLTGRGPLFLVIGFVVGNAAGIFLLYLRAQRADAREAAAKAKTDESAAITAQIQIAASPDDAAPHDDGPAPRSET